jgi:hypothetical protein
MKCKICNTKTVSFEDNQLKKIFHHCPSCELIFLDKEFYVGNDNEKKQYDHHNNSLENEGYVKMFEDFLNYFWKDFNNVLDFGSGPTPVLATLMQKRALHVEHFDKFYQTDEIYKNKTYELITSTEVFEHLENPTQVLKLLASHLKKDGTIAIMTLFHTNKQEDFLKWWYRRDPTHITFFTPKSIETMAKECGLEVTKHDNKRIIILKKLV